MPFQPGYEPPAGDSAEESFLDALPAGLTRSDQRLLYLYYEVGLTHEELARDLGCSAAASRMRLSRARAHCKELLLQERHQEKLLN
jgi:DNA-directed RNA polymerase specialized sigma24 family protein